MKEPSPPYRALRFLRWFCHREYLEEIEGDLTELYTQRAYKSVRSANWKFNFAVLRYFRPEFIRSIKGHSTQNHQAMLQHHLLLSFRNFRRNKTTFLINLLGLASGLACVLFIFLWVRDELNIDQFQSKQLYRVMEQKVQNDELVLFKTSSGPAAEALKTRFPEVNYAVTTTGTGVTGGTADLIMKFNQHEVQASGMYSSKDFFHVFSFPLLQGDPDQVLNDLRSVVISESLALKLFDDVTEAMGQTIEAQKGEYYTISGIFKDVPAASSIQFDYLLPLELFAKDRQWMSSWYSTAPATYLLLAQGADVNGFNAKIHDFVQKMTEGEVTHRTMFVQSFPDIYLHGDYENGVQSGGRIEYVRLFSIVAGFILFIACVNFMNLSTARASTRMKEIGVKKSIGAQRRQIIVQFFTESILISLCSFLLAALFVILLLPKFNEITGKNLQLNLPAIWLSALGIAIFTGFLAGSYPAIYLSSFKPASILKGRITHSLNEIWIRKGLVVVQFTLSVILIVSVLVVFNQIDYLMNKNLGYDRAQVIYFPSHADRSEGKETFLENIRKIPGILKVSSLAHRLTGHVSGTSGIDWPGKDPDNQTEFENIPVDYGAIELLGFEMFEGRSFSRERADSSSIIFNQTAVDFMGLESPIGQSIRLWGEEMQIIGVVKDFNFESLHDGYKPVFLRLSPSSSWNIVARIAQGKENQTISSLEKLNTQFYPGEPLEYEFLDQEYRQLYVSEQRVATLAKYFAGLAIIISCLGLFGLATFSAERRLKEIGIRKILGSGVTNIVVLLTGDFVRLVLLAIVIAIPFSVILANYWLQNFAFSIQLKWWFFASSGLIALIIAWVSVSLQTMRAAMVSPVNCIRNE